MYHFRDQIRCGNPTAFFVINGDVCGDFPLLEMCEYYGEKDALVVVAGTEATRNQSVNYGYYHYILMFFFYFSSLPNRLLFTIERTFRLHYQR